MKRQRSERSERQGYNKDGNRGKNVAEKKNGEKNRKKRNRREKEIEKRKKRGNE